MAVNDDDEIVCVAGSPKARMYILKGDVDTLLKSSMQITRAQGSMGTRPKRYLPLLFDCISRAMFLGKYINEELDSIQSQSPNLRREGALSIGK